MRICASFGSDNVNADDVSSADAVEVRTDIFRTVPKGILKKGQTGVFTFKTPFDASIIPKGWIVDVGEMKRPDIPNKVMTSYHDFERTPDVNTVISILKGMDGDIVKGAFTVNSLKDNVTLLNASKHIEKEHVILGMTELGRITRIRQNLMDNLYSYAYVGKATAPGQFSVPEMLEMGDDCIVTGIIGKGIGYTRSPAMHNAAFAHSKINGRYLTFDTQSLDSAGEFIVNFDIRGVNVTKPYKTDIVDHIDECDRISEDIGAVNTIVNDDGRLKGYNTDVDGIKMAFRKNKVSVRGMRALILGSGGAARACAYFLSENGCDTTVTGRNMDAASLIAREFQVTARERTSVAVKGYDLIVNCIPLNKSNDISEYPVKIEQIDPQQIVFDMVYGDTHLYDIANKRKCVTVRGEDMLAYQGIRSFELFTSKKVPVKVMRNAV
ncbi:MAG: type I 3-dehydroquinate dehydratase [Methanomassiliicoccaceae archaeon]|jgi:shikimate dehydrogenase|nr:type I 3-dehydroquinate dehydratase [Methanomassiliicoccaceae archaeon]